VGLSYELRPAGAGLFTSSTQKRIGITPHTITDLPTDEYVVTIERDGWAAVTENVVVKKGATARIDRDLSGGTVVINTDPSGAEVFADGESLGTTPLTLNAIKPGEVSYTLTRNLYHSTTVNGTVNPEKTTTLNVELESIEYIAKSTELDRWPAPIKRIEPTVPNPERFAGMSVVLDVTISDDGDPMDITVAEASDEELSLYCVDAVSQWRFKPGKVGRKDVWTRVTIPFNF
jgi:TonB family protein